MCTTTNYKKHRSNNPIQKFLISNFYKNFNTLIKPLNAQNILDAGCGEGITLNFLKQENIGKKRVGIDAEKKVINQAKKENPTDSFEVGSVYDLKFKDNSFDVVLCMEVLEHLQNPEKALKEIQRVSSKYIILTVPNEPLFRFSQLARGKYIKNLGNHPEHINHWNITSFHKFAESKGLKISKTKLPYPWIQILAEK